MPIKVLLVDDSQVVLRLAQCFLGDCITLTANSGQQAFDEAVAERPDLVLLDRHMPGWTEAVMLAALAKDERTRHIPIVIMTTEDHIASLGPGVDHIVKPFDAAGLVRKVNECVSRGSATGRNRSTVTNEPPCAKVRHRCEP